MRNDNWPSLLHSFIEERRHVPFILGKNDCVRFALDWVEVATNQKIEHTPYTDVKEAARVRRDAGGLKAFADENFGECVATSFAQRGDIVLSEAKNWDGFGVVVGGGYFAGPGEEAIVFERMQHASMAWRVG